MHLSWAFLGALALLQSHVSARLRAVGPHATVARAPADWARNPAPRGTAIDPSKIFIPTTIYGPVQTVRKAGGSLEQVSREVDQAVQDGKYYVRLVYTLIEHVSDPDDYRRGEVEKAIRILSTVGESVKEHIDDAANRLLQHSVKEVMRNIPATSYQEWRTSNDLVREVVEWVDDTALGKKRPPPNFGPVFSGEYDTWFNHCTHDGKHCKMLTIPYNAPANIPAGLKIAKAAVDAVNGKPPVRPTPWPMPVGERNGPPIFVEPPAASGVDRTRLDNGGREPQGVGEDRKPEPVGRGPPHGTDSAEIKSQEAIRRAVLKGGAEHAVDKERREPEIDDRKPDGADARNVSSVDDPTEDVRRPSAEGPIPFTRREHSGGDLIPEVRGLNEIDVDEEARREILGHGGSVRTKPEESAEDRKPELHDKRDDIDVGKDSRTDNLIHGGSAAKPGQSAEDRKSERDRKHEELRAEINQFLVDLMNHQDMLKLERVIGSGRRRQFNGIPGFADSRIPTDGSSHATRPRGGPYVSEPSDQHRERGDPGSALDLQSRKNTVKIPDHFDVIRPDREHSAENELPRLEESLHLTPRPTVDVIGSDRGHSAENELPRREESLHLTPRPTVDESGERKNREPLLEALRSLSSLDEPSQDYLGPELYGIRTPPDTHKSRRRDYYQMKSDYKYENANPYVLRRGSGW